MYEQKRTGKGRNGGRDNSLSSCVGTTVPLVLDLGVVWIERRGRDALLGIGVDIGGIASCGSGSGDSSSWGYWLCEELLICRNRFATRGSTSGLILSGDEGRDQRFSPLTTMISSALYPSIVSWREGGILKMKCEECKIRNVTDDIWNLRHSG